MAVPGRLVLAKNPSQRGVCPPILRCPGLPYTKYGCAGAPPGFYRAVRLSKKPVIASQCAHWRGNPFLKRTNPALFAGFCLKRYGFPRRFAPRSKCPWGTPRNDRGGVYRHAEQREALSFRASDRVTGVGIRSPYSGDIFRPFGTFFRPTASNRQATNLFKIFSYLSCCHFVTIYI